MSRIVVKGLPKNITEAKIRNVFGTKGTLTDVQLKYTREGKFRQFCFIGYKNEKDAKLAIEYFNNSCIQTSRIQVEPCAALGAEDKPRAWSKHTKEKLKAIEAVKKTEEKHTDNKKQDKLTKHNKLDDILGQHKDDPEFQEFMKVHDKKRLLWSNDAVETAEKDNENEENGNEDEEEVDEDAESSDEAEKLAEKPISDLEYMKSLMKKTKEQPKKEQKEKKEEIDLYTIKIRNLPAKIKRQDILRFFKPHKPHSVRLARNTEGFCYVGFKTEKEMKEATVKNKSFIKGKQVFFSGFTKMSVKNKNSPNDAKAEEKKNPKWAKQQEMIEKQENISESGRIFFRNLAYSTTEEDLQQLFEKYGPVAEVNLPLDAVTRKIKGFGTVTFVMPEHAMKAFNALDGSIFQGRLLHLMPATTRETDSKEVTDANEDNLTFAQQKARKQKQMAGNSLNWNSLFLGANAVADILARKFERSKEEILDTSSGGSSAAVRIALGETQIVIEMKKFLEESGVCLSAFEGPILKRSKTILLAKNLPADTTVEELTPLFAKYGPLARLILPPSGVTALIEFCDPGEARQAFKKLAYSKFKYMPLFLEWAPENTFSKPNAGEAVIPKQEPVETKKAEKEEKTEEDNVVENASEEHSETDDEPAEENTTLFLHNLNFKTVAETVRQHYKHMGAIHDVEIAKRKDANNPGKLISLGYGFIQFKKHESTLKVLKEMQCTEIDGNKVTAKRSERILQTPKGQVQRKPVAKKAQNGTKILVRNLPFQVKPKEVREIFEAFGELRALRLPLKTAPGESSIRGFGFVDFINKSDAKKAFDALGASTHLYGRRIVLEWASNDDEDLTELRKRTAQQFDNLEKSAKRSRKANFTMDDDTTAAQANHLADSY